MILFLVSKETGNEAESARTSRRVVPKKRMTEGGAKAVTLRKATGGRGEQKRLVFFHLNPSLKKSKAWGEMLFLKL